MKNERATVLVVDDEPELREIASEVLRGSGSPAKALTA